MLKNIVKGFVEMMNAINEGAKAHMDWEREEMQNLVMFQAGLR